MWLPGNLQQILNNSIPDVRQNIPNVRQNIPAYVPPVAPQASPPAVVETSPPVVSEAVSTNEAPKTSRRKGPGLGAYCKDREPAELARRAACRDGTLTGTPGVVVPNPLDSCNYGGACISGAQAVNYCSRGNNHLQRGCIELFGPGGPDDDNDDDNDPDIEAKRQAAEFGQQIFDATDIGQLEDLLENNPDMLNNPHLASWVEANGQFPITDDVGIWAELDNIFAECVQGRPCDAKAILDNLRIMFPSIINLPEWAAILGVGIFKTPTIWEMMQKVGDIFETVSGKIKCTKIDDDGNKRDCTATERISNSLCVLQPNADCCISDTCSPGDLIGGAIGSVVGIGTDVLGQVIGKIETLEDKITGAGKYGDILTGNCKEPDGTPKECTWADLPSEVLDDLIDIFGADSSKWPPWVWAIIGSSVLGGIVTKTNLTAEEEECAEKGGTWNGTSCELPDTPDDDNFCLDKYGEGVRANDNSPSKCEKPCNGGWIDADSECEQSLGCPEDGCPDVDGVAYECNTVLDKCVPVEGTSCAEQNRQDIPGNDLECGGCLGGFTDVDGVCVNDDDTPTDSCWDVNRETDSDGNCTENCKAGYVMGLDKFGEFSCIPKPIVGQDCNNPDFVAENPDICKNTDPDCAAQHRVTVSTGPMGIGAGETYCGQCISGYIDDGEGTCVPFKYTCEDPNSEVTEDGRCGDCKPGYARPTGDFCEPVEGVGQDCSDPDYAAANPDVCNPDNNNGDHDDDDFGGFGGGGGGGGGGGKGFSPSVFDAPFNPDRIPIAPLFSMDASSSFLNSLINAPTTTNQNQANQAGSKDVSRINSKARQGFFSGFNRGSNALGGALNDTGGLNNFISFYDAARKRNNRG